MAREKGTQKLFEDRGQMLCRLQGQDSTEVKVV
jgi:hypothetical protein